MIGSTLAAGHQAGAQTPRYRLTPLVKIGFLPQVDDFGSLGINNKGQVVYGYQATSISPIRAWVWLPSGDYGFPAGLLDLAAATTEYEEDDVSIARDINESGQIVGQEIDVVYGGSSARGVVWELDSNTVTRTQLGTLSASNPWSGANAINDEADPVIVGISRRDDACGCNGSGDEAPVERPFRLTFDGTNTLVELSVGGDSFGGAQDVNTPAGSNPLRVTGFCDCPPGVGGPCKKDPDDCDPQMDSTIWSPSTRGDLTHVNVSAGSRGRGVNDAEEFAGWGFASTTGDCGQSALYWSNPSASPVNLGSTMPTGQSTNRSRAEAINDASPAQVVGWNSSIGGALFWESPNGTPTVTDLNDVAAIGSCNSLWTLFEAHDINDNDWIITWGQNQGDDDIYAVLLTPFPACPVDVVPNGCADVADLLAVIAQWGACHVGAICSADTDANCAVNTADMLAVIAAWGCTPCGSSFAGGGSAPPTLEELFAIVLEAPVPSATQAEIIEELLANYNN